MSDSPARPLLDLNADRRGLERAFQTLVGGRPQPRPDPRLALALKLLQGLGFIEVGPGPALSHMLASDRRVVFNQAADDAEGAVLEWAARHFPEMEFYLPYITLRATRQKRLAATGKRVLTPEPDYDEDGFLAEYQ